MRKSEKKTPKRFLKRAFVLLVLLSGLIFPIACSDNNPNPTQPSINGASPTPTNVSLGPPGTPTPVPTYAVATPVFLQNVQTSAAPNGMAYDPGSNILYVATGENRGGIVNMFEVYSVLGGTTLAGGPDGNTFTTGIPTPGATPAWQGTTVVANLPQGFAYSAPSLGGTGWFGYLDTTTSGSAMFYEKFGPSPSGNYTDYTDGFDGVKFKSPKAVAADQFGFFYVADTGNGYVDVFDTGCACGPPFSPGWEHHWNGSSSSLPFKQPTALACDAAGNIWVGDSGYPNSVVQVYGSGGTTLIGLWNAAPNCVINGLAVDQSANCSGISGPCVYVSDTGNGGRVEEYTSTGILLRAWGDPHGAREFLPFVPSAIALIGNPITSIVVGDSNNDMLQVFGP